jgi:hypothetical protein
LLWMFVSKFIKLLGHFIRYPEDVILLPVSILFGYFHGFIKVYAFLSLNVVRATEVRSKSCVYSRADSLSERSRLHGEAAKERTWTMDTA